MLVRPSCKTQKSVNSSSLGSFRSARISRHKLFVCVERRKLADRFRGSGLPERAQCAGFIRHNVKHTIQLCNPQQMVDASARIHELELAATAANGRMRPHEFA